MKATDLFDRDLLQRVRSLATGPPLPGRLDSERAQILSTILTAGAVVSGTMFLLAPLWSNDLERSFLAYGSTFLLHVVHLWLVHRGFARTAAKSYSVLFFILTSILIFIFGGIRGFGGFIYPLVALFAGLTWSAWAAVGIAVAASLTALVMALVETQGLMSIVAPVPSAGAAWAVITASVAMTAVMLFVALRTIRASTLEAVESERQRRILETELAQAKRMEALGHLAGGVAHDFNNMLTGIIGHAELIGLRSPRGSDTARRAELILSSGEKAAQITRELLTFSRKKEHVVEDVHIHEIIGDVVAILERSIDRAIAVQTNLEARPDIVHGDSAQLEMALLNLAVNARDALARGGELVFRTRVVADDDDGTSWIRIDVSDTGTGMSGEVRDRIFEPYFTTKTVGRGTGLGLSAVYGTVQNHQGRIDVDTEEDRGTTFSIYLPLATGSIPQAEPVRRDGTLARPRSVLAIDDDDTVLELLEGFLGDMGHSLSSAKSGEEGLALYDADPGAFDLVILDIVMPGMPGREVLKELRRRDAHLPVIVTSGAVDESLETPELGDNVRFLAKPYRRAGLESAIAELATGSVEEQA